MALTFPATSASPWTDPNGTVWVWNGTAWGRRPVGVAALAGSVWEAATEYAQGDAVTNQWGELVTARTAHTSGASYDATKWFTPGSPDGGTVVDFTRLPDGPTTSARPVYGQIDYYSPSPLQYKIEGGRMVSSDAFVNAPAYFQIECSDTIQHSWAVFEVSATTTQNFGFLILFVDNAWYTTNDTHIASIHAQIVANTNGNTSVTGFSAGPYDMPADPAPKQGTATVPYSIVGRTVRYDVTCDKLTGETCYYIDGALVLQMTDPALVGYTSRYVIAEFAGPTYKLLQFGASPVMPLAVPAPPFHSDSNYSAVTTLSDTYQQIRTVPIKYGRSGRVLIEWAPYVTCTAGGVWFGLGTVAEGEPSASPAYKNRVCDATTRCRVMFRQTRSGTPGTTETVAIYGMTTGTATLQGGDYGGTGVTVTEVGSATTTVV